MNYVTETILLREYQHGIEQTLHGIYGLNKTGTDRPDVNNMENKGYN